VLLVPTINPVRVENIAFSHDFQYGPVTRTSYTSPTLDTTNFLSAQSWKGGTGEASGSADGY
jgi:hypothetical protein